MTGLPGPHLHAARAGRSAPRAVFVRHRLGMQMGGLTSAVLGRMRLFDSAGWQVHLGLITPDPDIDRTLASLRADGRLPVTVTVHHHGHDPVRRRRILTPWARVERPTVPAWLDGIVGREGAVVFAESPVTYEIVSKMRNPRLARVFAVHLCHLSAEAMRLGDAASIARGRLTARWATVSDTTLRSADRIVVLTESQRRDFHLRWGPDLPVDVIPHSAPQGPMPVADVDPTLVVGLGQLRRMKRWDDAIRAMALVVEQVPSARLVIHGSGEDRDRLLAVTEELGLSAFVTLAGYTTSPLQAMANAACTLSTTRREAMPLTLLESLSVGTPPVVYDVRYGASEIVRDGIDGFVVPGNDVPAAAGAVVRLLTQPDLRQRMSQAAREVTTRFSQQAHDSAWLDLGLDVHKRIRA